MRHINIEDLQRYRQELIEAEKSLATTEKYIRDIKTFLHWLGDDKDITKDRVIQYKEYLKTKYKVSSSTACWSRLIASSNTWAGTNAA